MQNSQSLTLPLHVTASLIAASISSRFMLRECLFLPSRPGADDEVFQTERILKTCRFSRVRFPFDAQNTALAITEITALLVTVYTSSDNNMARYSVWPTSIKFFEYE